MHFDGVVLVRYRLIDFIGLAQEWKRSVTKIHLSKEDALQNGKQCVVEPPSL